MLSLKQITSGYILYKYYFVKITLFVAAFKFLNDEAAQSKVPKLNNDTPYQ